jgi:hypothetical protein
MSWSWHWSWHLKLTALPSVVLDEGDVQHKAADHGLHSRTNARTVGSSCNRSSDCHMRKRREVGQREVRSLQGANHVSEGCPCKPIRGR